MPCLFDKLTFTLFGSSNNTHFDSRKSLKANFIRMCRLPLHKINSRETDKLLGLLNFCDLYSSKNSLTPLNDEQRMHDIAMLELVDQAIREWFKKRQEVSTRVALVERYHFYIQCIRENLVETDSRMASIRHAKHWTSPLYQSEKLKTYFSSPLKQYLKQHYPKENQAEHEEKIPTEASPLLELLLQRNKKLFYSILFPFFNTLNDLDLFDCLCDSLNICADLIRVF